MGRQLSAGWYETDERHRESPSMHNVNRKGFIRRSVKWIRLEPAFLEDISTPAQREQCTHSLHINEAFCTLLLDGFCLMNISRTIDPVIMRLGFEEICGTADHRRRSAVVFKILRLENGIKH